MAQIVCLIYRISFLLKNEISKQLSDLFNLSFMTDTFPLVPKTAKVVLIFKKDTKLDYNYYHLISLLLNIEKNLEKSATILESYFRQRSPMCESKLPIQVALGAQGA